MVDEQVLAGPGGRVVAMDSISLVDADDAGAWVVSASHGGSSSGTIALQVALAGAFFNDAGVGKDRAGVAALAMLQAHGIPAGTVSHTSARIGDARDTWRDGVVSHVNDAASARGIRVGERVRDALARIVGAS